jgi:hypothetical protein
MAEIKSCTNCIDYERCVARYNYKVSAYRGNINYESIAEICKDYIGIDEIE